MESFSPRWEVTLQSRTVHLSTIVPQAVVMITVSVEYCLLTVAVLSKLRANNTSEFGVVSSLYSKVSFLIAIMSSLVITKGSFLGRSNICL